MRNFGVWQDGDDGFSRLDHDWLSRFQKGTDSFLFDDSGLLDHAHVGSGAAIADGRFIGVHLDERVVDPHAGKRGEDVLNGMNLDAAFDERGGAFDRFDVLDPGFDDGIVGKIRALKLKAMADRRGMKREGDFLTCMQGGTCEAG